MGAQTVATQIVSFVLLRDGLLPAYGDILEHSSLIIGAAGATSEEECPFKLAQLTLAISQRTDARKESQTTSKLSDNIMTNTTKPREVLELICQLSQSVFATPCTVCSS